MKTEMIMSEEPLPGAVSMKMFPDDSEVYDSIERLAIGINTVAYMITTSDFKGFRGTVHKVTKEVSDMLADIPENKNNWDLLYSMVMPYALHATGRNTSDGDYFIAVFGDYYSDEAKEQVKHIKNK